MRINRLTRVINIMEFFYFRNQLLSTNHTLNMLEFVFVWTSLFIHCTGCILILICCNLEDNMLPHMDCELHDTTLKKFKIYATYMYILVNMFTNAAQQMYRPGGLVLALILMLLMVVMTILIAIFYSQIFLIVYKNYFTRVNFTNKVDRMQHFVEREEVSLVLVERIQVYIQRLWMRHRGVLYPVLLDQAPHYLSEAILNASYSDHIINHPIFFKCHIDFQRQIVAKLRDNIYFPGDFVAFQEDMNDCMFFIHRGEIVASTETEGKAQKVFRTYRQGQVFGVLQGRYIFGLFICR